MLAYGAAAPSILLLMKFKLLHVLLPFQVCHLLIHQSLSSFFFFRDEFGFQAAYLDQASETSLPSSLMLVVSVFFIRIAFFNDPFLDIF